jgi:hypothetical protein
MLTHWQFFLLFCGAMFASVLVVLGVVLGILPFQRGALPEDRVYWSGLSALCLLLAAGVVGYMIVRSRRWIRPPE